MKKFFSDIYNVFLVVLGTLASLPILAPLLLKLGLEGPAKIIYFIYSFFCHQFASRSINLYDYQFAWCARDTGIWISIFIAALLVKMGKLPKLRWYWVIPFIIPMALDGGLQTIFTFFNIAPSGILEGMPLYVSNNLARFMTGVIFGVGVGWWIGEQLRSADSGVGNGESSLSLSSQQVSEGEGKSEIRYQTSDVTQDTTNDALPTTNSVQSSQLKAHSLSTKIKNSRFSILISSCILFLAMFFVYVGLVQLWNVTSVNNKPLNALDSVVKTPSDNFFARRGNGVCPTTTALDLLALDCFF